MSAIVDELYTKGTYKSWTDDLTVIMFDDNPVLNGL